MIKHIPSIFLILILSLIGCKTTGTVIESTIISQPTSPTITSFTQTLTTAILPSISPTITTIPPSPTMIPSYTSSVTPTPLDTLEPSQVDEAVAALLRNPDDCIAPCFWGILPGKTSYNEANQFFYHFGITPSKSIINGKNYLTYEYQLDNDISIVVLLGLQNNIVENSRIGFVTEAIEGKVASEWMAYSPNTLIKLYGQPTQVNFYWSLGERTTFTINLYYTDYDFIVQYHSFNGPEPSSPTICPLEVKYDDIRLWMGKNPYYPPTNGVSLDKGTSLSMNEFVKLMTGDPKNSCFTLDINAFLPQP